MSDRTGRSRTTWACWTSLIVLGCGASGTVAEVGTTSTDAPRAAVPDVAAESAAASRTDLVAAVPSAPGPNRVAFGATGTSAADDALGVPSSAPVASGQSKSSANDEVPRAATARPAATDRRPARPSEEVLVAQGPVAAVAAAPSAALVPKSDFVFPADGVGQVLRERLQPLGSVSAPAPSYTPGPSPWFALHSERIVDRRLLPFAPAPASQAPRLDARDSGVVNRALPALDAPPLILSAAVPRPAPVYLPESAKLSEPSLARNEPAWMRALGRPDHVAPTAGADPARDPARESTLPRVHFPRNGVAPLSDFGIPDPFVLSREARLKSAPAETDPPQGPPGGLPRPVLGGPPASPAPAK